MKKIHIDDVDIDQKINVFITEKWKKGNAGCLAFEIWDKLKDCIQENAVKDEMKTLLRHYRIMEGVYLECERKLQKEYSEEDVFFQGLFSGISQCLYNSLLKNLGSFQREQEDISNWDMMLLDSGKIEYLRKEIKIEKKDGIERKLKNILCNYSENMIHEFIQGKIDIYREITSDLFMCSMMGLDSFGYLVVVAENFVFKEKNKAAMYQRVSMVLQCLSKKRSKISWSRNNLTENLWICCVGKWQI